MYRPMDIKFFCGSETEISKPHFLSDGLQFIPWKQLATTKHTTILCGNFSDGLLSEQPLTFTISCSGCWTGQCIVLSQTLAWPHVGLQFLFEFHVTFLMVTQAHSINRDIPQWPPAEGEPMSGIHLRMNERLQYDNPNVLAAKGIFIDAILGMGVTTNTLRHNNPTVIKK